MQAKTSGASPRRSLIELDPRVTPKRALTDQIYSALKHRILTCSLPPAQRLVEKDLCEDLGSSRTPLREALNRLVSEELVILAPYRGYVVAPLTIDGFRTLCELRSVFEPETVALAAQRATEEDIEEMAAAAEYHCRPGDKESFEAFLRANSQFHLALVRCTRNPRLEAIIMSAIDQHQRPCYLGLEMGMNVEASNAEHLAIVAAVRAHNPIKARELMANHLAAAEQRIIAAIQAAGYQ